MNFAVVPFVSFCFSSCVYLHTLALQITQTLTQSTQPITQPLRSNARRHAPLPTTALPPEACTLDLVLVVHARDVQHRAALQRERAVGLQWRVGLRLQDCALTQHEPPLLIDVAVRVQLALCFFSRNNVGALIV